MSYPRCEWGNPFTFFGIPDAVAVAIAGSIRPSCGPYGVDLEPWPDEDRTRRPFKCWEGRRVDVLGP